MILSEIFLIFRGHYILGLGFWSPSQLQVGKSGYTPELMLTIHGFGTFAQGYFSSSLKYLSNF